MSKASNVSIPTPLQLQAFREAHAEDLFEKKRKAWDVIIASLANRIVKQECQVTTSPSGLITRIRFQVDVPTYEVLKDKDAIDYLCDVFAKSQWGRVDVVYEGPSAWNPYFVDVLPEIVPAAQS